MTTFKERLTEILNDVTPHPSHESIEDAVNVVRDLLEVYKEHTEKHYGYAHNTSTRINHAIHELGFLTDWVVEQIELEDRSWEDIFTRDKHIGLVGFGEILDNSGDLYDNKIVNEDTQRRYNILMDSSFLTVWALWNYFRGDEGHKQTYQVVYDGILKKEQEVTT